MFIHICITKFTIDVCDGNVLRESFTNNLSSLELNVILNQKVK